MTIIQNTKVKKVSMLIKKKIKMKGYPLCDKDLYDSYLAQLINLHTCICIQYVHVNISV